MRDNNLHARKRFQVKPVSRRVSVSAAVRQSASFVVGQVFPSGRQTYELLPKADLSRARNDGGALAKVALMLMSADSDGRAEIVAWLEGVVRAYDRDGECVASALRLEHEADLQEDMTAPDVFADPSPANLRRWLPGARKQYVATGRAIAAVEAALMKGEGA